MAKLYFVLLLFLLGSCAIEEAQPQNDAKLIIAQDFLSKAQKKVLVKIAKRREIDLSIRDLSAKEIRNILRKNPWEPGFDMVLLGGLKAQQTLQNITFQYHEADYGIIPIGISYKTDTVVKVKHFKDLSENYLWAPADAYAQTLLSAHLSYVYRNREKDKAVNKAYKAFKRGLKEHRLAFDHYNLQNTLLLCRYDTYLHYLKKEVPSRKFTYALQNKTDYYADYLGLYIVAQTKNYQNAKKMRRFLHYLRANNPKFRRAFGMIEKPSKRKQPTPSTLLDFLEK
ncbi:MAG: hypothetical protein ACKOWX_07830 [Flavobacteriales bacterium]